MRYTNDAAETSLWFEVQCVNYKVSNEYFHTGFSMQSFAQTADKSRKKLTGRISPLSVTGTVNLQLPSIPHTHISSKVGSSSASIQLRQPSNYSRTEEVTPSIRFRVLICVHAVLAGWDRPNSKIVGVSRWNFLSPHLQFLRRWIDVISFWVIGVTVNLCPWHELSRVLF